MVPYPAKPTKNRPEGANGIPKALGLRRVRGSALLVRPLNPAEGVSTLISLFPRKKAVRFAPDGLWETMNLATNRRDRLS